MIEDLFTCDPWPHQLFGVSETINAFNSGITSVCLTAPTGAGKTQMQIALARWGAQQGKVLCLTNRILLTDQTRRVFGDSGVSVGVISSSRKAFERDDCKVQIATIQTILARRRSDSNYWVDADLVLADEVHQMASGESAALLNEYRDRGSKVCGVTATPLGVSNVCDKLIVAASTRDLQKDGILCQALWYAPSELDTRKLVKGKVDLSVTESDARRTWGPLRGKNEHIRTRIVGNILQHYEQLHPERTHTLAFAPGVKESLWAAQFCYGRGIRSLHVDGQDFWFDGQMYDRKQSEKVFEDAMQLWRDGEIPILWNRFVLREGIDEPQIKCIMLATPIGSYRSFLQMVGRGLRIHVSKDKCLVIDFGGAWWRHGSVNVNVDWESVYDCQDPDTLSKNRIAEQREHGEPMGRVCANCGMVHKYGRIVVCQYCGHKLNLGKPSRPILQADGMLTQVEGEPVARWKIQKTPEAQGIWKGLYWNAVKKHNGDVTFNELYARFGYKTAVLAGSKTQPAFWKSYYPPRDLQFMPKNPNDWHRRVGEVSMDTLH